MEVDKRDITFDKAKDFFVKIGGKVIVEIGSIRKEGSFHKQGDGHSTFFWQSFAPEVYSVDIDEDATLLTSKITQENVTAINEDGIVFLEKFQKPIDLLYLDGCGPDVEGYQEFHLSAYRAAKFSEKSILLIDDCFSTVIGKGALVLPEAEKDGFELVMMKYQTLLVRGIVFLN